MSQFSMKSSGFHEKWQFSFEKQQFSCEKWFSCEKQQFSYEKLINQITEHKLFNFMVCRVEAMSQDSIETAACHDNHHFSYERHLHWLFNKL